MVVFLFFIFLLDPLPKIDKIVTHCQHEGHFVQNHLFTHYLSKTDYYMLSTSQIPDFWNPTFLCEFSSNLCLPFPFTALLQAVMNKNGIWESHWKASMLHRKGVIILKASDRKQGRPHRFLDSTISEYVWK